MFNKKKQKVSEQNQICENYEFKLTEVVFAKVRGYPDWPARITSKINDNRYGVIFFGDNTTYVFLYVAYRHRKICYK